MRPGFDVPVSGMSIPRPSRPKTRAYFFTPWRGVTFSLLRLQALDFFFDFQFLFLHRGEFETVHTRVPLCVVDLCRKGFMFPAEFLEMRTHGHGLPPLAFWTGLECSTKPESCHPKANENIAFPRNHPSLKWKNPPISQDFLSLWAKIFAIPGMARTIMENQRRKQSEGRIGALNTLNNNAFCLSPGPCR